MTPARPSSVPWRAGDLNLLCGMLTLGLAGVVAGWFGASGSTDPRTEELWLTGAIVAAVVAGVGNALWLLAGYRAVRIRARAAAAAIAELLPAQAAMPAWADAPALAPVVPAQRWDTATFRAGALVATATMVHFHAPDCHLAAGKPVAEDTAAGHAAAGRRPCGVCRPPVPA